MTDFQLRQFSKSKESIYFVLIEFINEDILIGFDIDKKNAYILKSVSFNNYKKLNEIFNKSKKLHIEILNTEKEIDKINPKAILQEYTQGIAHKLPVYEVVDEIGKQHDKTFFVEVSFENKVIGKGSAKSIKEAQIQAAKDALDTLGIK